MADQSVSVPMTLSDPERLDARNQILFRRILITLVRSATSLHLQKCAARFVSDSWVSCFTRATLCIARSFPSCDVCPSVLHTPVLRLNG